MFRSRSKPFWWAVCRGPFLGKSPCDFNHAAHHVNYETQKRGDDATTGSLGALGTPGPGGTMAGFEPASDSDPVGGMAGFGVSASRANRRYRATVSRSIPNSRAILRWDQPVRLNVTIDCCISILSWCIAAQGHEIDPDCNDYLTSKWLVLIRPLLAGFDRPRTTSSPDVDPRLCS